MKQNVKLSIEEQDELERAIELLENPYSFEYYCGACDNFNTDNCKFKDKVSDYTNWKYINCKDFWS